MPSRAGLHGCGLLAAGFLAACGTRGSATRSTADASAATPVADGGGGVTIGPAGGKLVTFGLEVDIPPGALPSPVSLSVAMSTAAPPAGYQLLTPLYRFGPRALMFAVPVTIHVELAGAPPSGASVYWSRASGSGYDALPTTFSSMTATTVVSHFSTGFVGIAEPGAEAGAGPTDASAASDAQEGGPGVGGDAAAADASATDASAADAAAADANPSDGSVDADVGN